MQWLGDSLTFSFITMCNVTEGVEVDQILHDAEMGVFNQEMDKRQKKCRKDMRMASLIWSKF